MRLRRDQSLLLVVDVQEKLAPHVLGHEHITRRSAALARLARLLQIPAYASEHCPERIGATIPALRGHFDAAHVLRKVFFSCADEPACLARLRAEGRPQVVVAGMEAHVCVMQTVLGLRARGFEAFPVHDAIGSRRADDREAALARMSQAGCPATSAEMAMFEWLHHAEAPEFRQALEIVKAL